ncbi:MAG: hypothetical protein L6R36_003484 [Xanthoria steineri]|nr:MAG: hypothetical protein L6R36_003484 [Xanthoria steineri]
MDPVRRGIRPFEQRPAYSPTDPIAFLKLQQLRCVRGGSPDLGPEWLDPAGIFHHICHPCDSQKPSTNPDLTFILRTIDCSQEPDMSWIKGFYNGKRKKPAKLKASPSNIDVLPPIQEDEEDVVPASLDLATPVKKRSGEQRRVRIDTRIEVSGYPVPAQLQWTPQAQRQKHIPNDTLDAPSHEPLSDDEEEQDRGITSAQAQTKHKLCSWANNSPDTDTATPDQSFEDWLEEEEEEQQQQQQPRKKLRLSY